VKGKNSTILGRTSPHVRKFLTAGFTENAFSAKSAQFTFHALG